LILLFFNKVSELGANSMTAKAKQANAPVAKTAAKPPYPFRLFWALVLLFGNFVVAAFYFHILE
jgi:photosystem I protein